MKATERQDYITYLLEYIILLTADVYYNTKWTPNQRASIIDEVEYRLSELKTILKFTTNRGFWYFMAYQNKVPVIISEQINDISEKTRVPISSIRRAMVQECIVDGYSFDRFGIGEIHGEIKRLIKNLKL